MASESVAEPFIVNALTEVVKNNFVANLINTHNLTNYNNININNNNSNIHNYGELLALPTNATTTATEIASSTLRPHSLRPLLRLSESLFMIATNTTNNTIFPLLVNRSRTFVENDGLHLEHAPKLSPTTMIKVYVLVVMAILSLFGNVLTMWNIYKTRIRRRSSRHTWSAIYSLIFHLSIADLLVTGFCIVGEAAWFYTVQWLAGEIACKLVKLFQMFSLYLSTYILVLIGVDRWIAVKYPMKSLNRSQRSTRLICGTYVISFVLSIPQFFIFHLARGPFVEEFHQCVTHGFYTAHWQEQLYTIFTLIFTFLLPLCILFLTYMSTFCTISNSEKMFMGPSRPPNSAVQTMQTNRQRLIHKAKMKSLRISVVIIIAFIICWTPYYVMMIILMFLNPDKKLSEGLVSVIFAFGMSNSLVNPVIYGAFHLRPMKKKSSQKNGHAGNSLNRADSQRTPSVNTAVTQIDANGRQLRSFRKASYHRTSSIDSNSKEHISLLQMSGNNVVMHNFNSERSSRNSCTLYRQQQQQQQQQQKEEHQHTQTSYLIVNQYEEANDDDEDDDNEATLALSVTNNDGTWPLENSYGTVVYSCKNPSKTTTTTANGRAETAQTGKTTSLASVARVHDYKNSRMSSDQSAANV